MGGWGLARSLRVKRPEQSGHRLSKRGGAAADLIPRSGNRQSRRGGWCGSIPAKRDCAGLPKSTFFRGKTLQPSARHEAGLDASSTFHLTQGGSSLCTNGSATGRQYMVNLLFYAHNSLGPKSHRSLLHRGIGASGSRENLPNQPQGFYSSQSRLKTCP